jgi:hypothetical protein
VDLDLLGLMSVQYVADWAAPAEGARRVHYAGEQSLPRTRAFRVYENPAFLPRARLVGSADVEADDAAALARLRSPDYPRAEAVVLASGAPHRGPPGPAGTATIVIDAPDLVRVEVEPAHPGWLVLSDTWFPGWRARVDGVERELLRANVAFRAVRVEPGDRQVEFVYRPLAWRAGRAIALATLLGAIGGLPLARRRAAARERLLECAAPSRSQDPWTKPPAPTDR